MNEINVTNKDLKKHFSSITEMYQAQTPSLTFSAIIMGLSGTGKTRFITTGPKPWLVDSFDPKGTIVLEKNFEKEIQEGNLVIRKFWNEDSNVPTEHARWEAIHDEDIRTGFLNLFGTYAVDSFTTWLDACANRISVLMKRNRKVQKLAINDYLIVYDHAKDFIKQVSTCDCNFILTAHLQEYMKNDDQKECLIKAYSSLRTDIPLLFTEKYVLEAEEAPPPKGVNYYLYTRSAGTFRASTQLGSNGELKAKEIPDLKVIMQKTGFNGEDKKSLKEVLK
ncbi:MAG: AAA family ATPase [Alphaproteobacteria bacterium]|nr:AAA family ATPase [Alphaproteobacteria bacterium]